MVLNRLDKTGELKMNQTMIMNTVQVALLGLCILAAGAASAEPSYLGSKSCAGCHKSETQDWQRSVHGKAMEILVAGKRYLHRFKKQGGFVDMTSTPDLAGVGCESCHVPASGYREIHKQKMLDFKSAEVRAAGQT